MNFLLLRGLIRESRHWGSFPKALEASIPGSRTFFLDLPGVGTEISRPSPYTVPAIRADIRNRFEEKIRSGEFPKGPWTLVAISMGAMVGMDWLWTSSTRFEKAILMNTSARDAGYFWHRFKFPVIPGMARSLIDFRPEVYEKLILRMTSNLPEADRYVDLDTHVGWSKDLPVRRRTFLAQLFAASRFKLPPALHVPGLVLVSERDRLVSSFMSEKVATKYRFELRRHLWAGHDLPKDDPDWVVEEIRRYLLTDRASKPMSNSG